MSAQTITGTWRDLVLAMMLKFALLVALYAAFFSPSHRAPADIAGHFFNVSPIETGTRE